ncbi:MAG: deoxyguanosinetriphosphate triphosphohydrolase [Bacteroidetes bacterium]|nr:MAG: deoxyguanosinetriphosphate triphosphohydrolase [Bacteroidota bacterium]
MNWNSLFTQERHGTGTITRDSRSEFQRDFDRLIFSSGLRRMQNKTQVFPLPGIAFVHNRLTHSLEVASVGRSLGKIVGNYIVNTFGKDFNYEETTFYLHELSHVIAAACLAHDIGNPPFGHSGEKAISKYFIDNKDTFIEGRNRLRDYFDTIFWDEFLKFEGNANGLRYLTHSFNGKVPGGLRLTYTTLASMLKYPCPVNGIDNNFKHRSKFNFFQSEKNVFKKTCEKTNMLLESNNPLLFKRHPFVYLTEAADDICYKLIDIEDAQRLKIIDSNTVISLLLNLIKCLKVHDFRRVEESFDKIKDTNDKVSYLRAKCINALTVVCADRFMENSHEIINGLFNDELISIVNKQCSEMKEITKVTKQQIYNHPKVMKIELAGYQILYDLLALFVPAVLKHSPTHMDTKLKKIIPNQFMYDESIANISNYEKVFSVLDFLSGMTDEYALQLYKQLKGIEINTHD